MLEDYLWRLFEKTGSIKTYMDYKNLRKKSGEGYESDKNTGFDN